MGLNGHMQRVEHDDMTNIELLDWNPKLQSLDSMLTKIIEDFTIKIHYVSRPFGGLHRAQTRTITQSEPLPRKLST